MKKQNIYFIIKHSIAFCLLMIMSLGAAAQDSTQADNAAPEPVVKKKSFVKNTFEGNYLIDNQTVMLPIKGTFEFAILHRFGIASNGFKDMFGLFASAKMRLGFSYVPVKNLQVGFGASNDRMQVDWNLKYALLQQTKDEKIPVSVTYFGNAVMDTRKQDATTLFVSLSDRFSYFNQIMIARKVTDKFSIQVSPSLSHFNNLQGYIDSSGKVQQLMKNDHFAISFSARYKIAPQTAIIANYDQPLTEHPANNPHPNISIGLEMRSSGHDFQVFVGNYGYILPQNNAMFNQNDFTKGQFLIGFNITRLWNF
ncbi:hypothetical protein FW778_03345 [Ginsengibacter hankyongi]|uniref:DUF5777 domain-containing protein n=1 Tax=Ginsengibacter hankyongi TaxID=2607284 RepID=A0A5J5IJ69_9BACT|nr:DUF5777 family beta-barrel protein [Ginsengibacter hankyongi]KAA9041089.1 hypothetical protein FW778_03345 [Ginsengibacter hankyongi]